MSFTLVGDIWHPTKYAPEKVITWVVKQPTGWVSEPCLVWCFHPTNVPLLSPSRLFTCLTMLSERRNELSEEETLVTKCFGDETRWVFSDPIYSNNSLLGKGSRWCRSIFLWFLISAFLTEIKGHLEVLRDTVIWSAPLLEFLCCLSHFGPLYLSHFICLSLFSLSLLHCLCFLSLNLSLLFFLSLYFIHWSSLLWTVS